MRSATGAHLYDSGDRATLRSRGGLSWAGGRCHGIMRGGRDGERDGRSLSAVPDGRTLLTARTTDLGARRQGLGARRALRLYCVEILPEGVGRVAPLSYSAKRFTLKCLTPYDRLRPVVARAKQGWADE